MYPPLFALCAASNAVKSAIGSDPVRLYPFGEAPQGVAKPYAVWQVIGGSPYNFLAGAPDTDMYAVQVDVYADNAAAARGAAKAIRDAVETRAHITAWRGESRDIDTRDFRYSFDIDFHVVR